MARFFDEHEPHPLDAVNEAWRAAQAADDLVRLLADEGGDAYNEAIDELHYARCEAIAAFTAHHATSGPGSADWDEYGEGSNYQAYYLAAREAATGPFTESQ